MNKANDLDRSYFERAFAPQEGLTKLIQKPFRDELCLNGYWQFMPIAISQEDLKEESIPDMLFEKDVWEDVDIKIPSPWNVNSFTDGEGGDFKSFPSYPKSWETVQCGWLMKTVRVPVDWTSHRIIIHFEAIAGFAKIFINNQMIGSHFDAFLPFEWDITDYAKPGEEVQIAVWVAHGSLFDLPGEFGYREHVSGSFWGTHIVGIWQDVYLQKKPKLYVEDVFIKPLVKQKKLTLEITVKNTSQVQQKFSVDGKVHMWDNQTETSILDQPEINWSLGDVLLEMDVQALIVEAKETKIFHLSSPVDGDLPFWSPETPNLLGLVLDLKDKDNNQDRYYERFGWRQFEIKGKNLFLNDQNIQIKGDSWHFMGVPQMTRRYAYAWYKMLKDANANGVRLHAQIFPRFYLEMADEMGMCVLDETAIWFSDSGPKIDSEAYWEASHSHVKGMVLRDRNHPSIFGWSVCNETLEVTERVFHAPKKLLAKNVNEINRWVKTVKGLDSTRSWISGDGEVIPNTDLPTRIAHYTTNIENFGLSLLRKPWGVGETGMGYYGTPKQVSKINGDRAYESQLGRMEGLAGEAFDLIKNQRNLNAAYTSVFNLVWYGLKPLPLGLKDTSKPFTLHDGIFFGDFVEGKPGYQPERLGPYSSTLNPGYESDRPLYEEWPMFDAVKLAYSDHYRKEKNRWMEKIDNTVNTPPLVKKEGFVWLSSLEKSMTREQFEALGVNFIDFNILEKQLIIIDSMNPPIDESLLTKLGEAMNRGSTVLVYNAEEKSNQIIEVLTGKSSFLHNRSATSYVIKDASSILRNESNSSLYFSEIMDKPVSKHTLGGEWLNEAAVVLEASHTDWMTWNYQPETTKTAKVYRNELEEKPPGTVIAYQSFGEGELIVSTLDLFSLPKISKKIVLNLLRNLGGPLSAMSNDAPKVLNKRHVLKMAKHKINDATPEKLLKTDIFCQFKFESHQMDKPINHQLSFYLFSPRSQTDLLIEPGLPRLDLEVKGSRVESFSLNEIEVNGDNIKEDVTLYKGVPLEKGWNHVVIEMNQNKGNADKFKIRFKSNNKAFLQKITAMIER